MMPLRLPFHYIAQAVAPSGWHVKLLATIAGFWWGYVADGVAERQAVTALFILMACDIVTGISASLRRGRKLSSRRLTDTAFKFVGYVCAIITASALAHVIPDGFTEGAVVGITTLLVGAEVVSIAENIRHLGVKDHGMLRKIADALISESGEEDPRGPKDVRKGP
jgi:phage-related holin